MKGWSFKDVKKKKLDILGVAPVIEKRPMRNGIKAGWRRIGGVDIYFRSMWEANYGRYLQFLKETGNIMHWEHEPETFWFDGIKRGNVSYLPDFRVTLKNQPLPEYHEVKGYMDRDSEVKIKRFRKFFPQLTLHVIDKIWFQSNTDKICKLIPDWEYGTRK